MMTKPVGCILAGGLARRMGGGDKGLLELAGRPVLDHVLERIRPQVSELCLNANGDPARFAHYNLPVVADSVEGFAGPLAGILAGLDWAAGLGAERLITIATDTPFLPNDLVERLCHTATSNKTELVCASSNDRHHPVIGLWPVALRDDLRHALVVENIRKVDIWTDRHNRAVTEFSADVYDPFFNVNRPDDMMKAQQIFNEFQP